MGNWGKGRVHDIASVLLPLLNALSKPQRLQALVYLAGLIRLEKFRSFREIAAHFGHRHTDRLQHLLAHATLSAVRLQQSLHASLASLSANQTAVLALNDTYDPRKGNAIKGAG